MEITEWIKTNLLEMGYDIDKISYDEWHWNAVSALAGYAPRMPIKKAWEVIRRAYNEEWEKKHNDYGTKPTAIV